MKKILIIAVATLVFSASRACEADTYVAGLSAAADSAEGASVNALLDYGFNDRASLAVDVGATRADSAPDAIRSTNWELAFNYNFWSRWYTSRHWTMGRSRRVQIGQLVCRSVSRK